VKSLSRLVGTPTAVEEKALQRGESITAHTERDADGEVIVVLDSALSAWFAERLDGRDAEYRSAFAALERILLGHGGRYVAVPPQSPVDLGELVRSGKFLPPGPVRRMVGPPDQCHLTTACLVDLGLVDLGMTGYGLSESGAWIEHSWGMAGGRVVEPTRETWAAYFGAELRSENFALLEFSGPRTRPG